METAVKETEKAMRKATKATEDKQDCREGAERAHAKVRGGLTIS